MIVLGRVKPFGTSVSGGEHITLTERSTERIHDWRGTEPYQPKADYRPRIDSPIFWLKRNQMKSQSVSNKT